MKKQVTTLSILAALMAWAFPSLAAPTYWNTGTGHNNHGYEVFLVTGGINWTTAETNAVALGGHLASITSAEENSFVYSLVSSNTSFWALESTGRGIGPWLGAFQPSGSSEPSGGFQWVDGDPFVYTNWAGGEPSNGVGSPGNAGLNIENRIHFFGINGGAGPQWNDYPTSPISPQTMPVAYIVETTAPVPEPETYAMMLAGLGLLGVMALRRKQKLNA